MRRVIRRTRTSGGTSRQRYRDNDFNRNDELEREKDDYSERKIDPASQDKPTAPAKKKSPWGIIIIIIIIGAVIYFATRGSSESTEETRQTAPEEVVKAVIVALGQNNKTTAKSYVASGDSAVTAQVDALFNNYSGYFTHGDDYLSFSGMNYVLINPSETEATVTVSGSAEAVEVSYEYDEDEWGDEVEYEVEAVVDEATFSTVVFNLTKTGEQWYLSQVPSTIF